MRLMITAAVAALALVFAGTAADAKKAKTKTYTFETMCPAISPKPVHMGNCSASGKSMEAARATCQGKHLMCSMKNAKKAKAKHKKRKHRKS